MAVAPSTQPAFSYEAKTGASRTGTLTIAGQTFTLTQAPCAYSISPDTVKIDDGGGTGTISVSTGSTCTFTLTQAPRMYSTSHTELGPVTWIPFDESACSFSGETQQCRPEGT